MDGDPGSPTFNGVRHGLQAHLSTSKKGEEFETTLFLVAVALS